jgi:hypothetical protein
MMPPVRLAAEGAHRGVVIVVGVKALEPVGQGAQLFRQVEISRRGVAHTLSPPSDGTFTARRIEACG